MLTSTPYVSQVIAKISQRCNLDCTYCYVYNRGDESWRTRPKFMSEEVARQLALRIRDHCERHGSETFTVELHGGEPLLVGKTHMQRLVDLLRAGTKGVVELRIVMQTNGTLLDRDWIELFARNAISFGVSLDGPPNIGDRRRVWLDGSAGTTERVLRNIARLRVEHPAFEDLFGGCLCVVDPECDGATMVEWFVEQGLSEFDFLLPDGNRANLPQGWTGVEPYRRFLCEAFDSWYQMNEHAPHIRMFEQMLMGKMGRRTPLDALGGDLRQLCVVESDGSIGVNDVTRICGGVYSRDLLNIFEHHLDDHSRGYDIDAIQSLSEQCAGCTHLDSCGGGYLPHRFDGSGFQNPSLYCEALYALSERMQGVLASDLRVESRGGMRSLEEVAVVRP